MSRRYVKGTAPKVIRDWGDERGARINKRMQEHLDRLIAENSDDPESLKPHSYGQIYPLIAYKWAFEEEGISPEESYRWLHDEMMEMCDEMTAPVKKILRFCGLWKTVPSLFSSMTVKLFGPDAGFSAEFIEKTKMRSRFDMKVCPYWEKFRQYGCPELCRICCASDDRTYGNLHPELEWNRSTTLARGGDRCDFEMKRRK